MGSELARVQLEDWKNERNSRQASKLKPLQGCLANVELYTAKRSYLYLFFGLWIRSVNIQVWCVCCHLIWIAVGEAAKGFSLDSITEIFSLKNVKILRFFQKYEILDWCDSSTNDFQTKFFQSNDNYVNAFPQSTVEYWKH